MTESDPSRPGLVVEGGPLDGFMLNIDEGSTVVVGSGRLATLRVDHPDIELAHVKVVWDELGIAMRDNGSRHGTWVAGERVETAGLIDGDLISFVPLDSPSSAPRIRVHIPEGTVVVTAPPEPEAPATEEPAAAPRPDRSEPRRPPRAPKRRRPRKAIHRAPAVALGATGLLVLGLGTWAAWRFLLAGGGPELSSVAPLRAEVGSVVTLTGSGFAPDPADNTVWFADRPVPAISLAGAALKAAVPPLGRAGTVAVSVETARGRSGPLSLEVLPALRTAAVEPRGALPGDEVTVLGEGFDGGVVVTVGGLEATLVGVEEGAVRFTMPAVQGPPGSEHPVEITVNGRSTHPLNVVLGRLPLVLGVEPPRAVAGEPVQIRGLGFSADPAGNEVTFDGVPVLVLSATERMLQVVAPASSQPRAETMSTLLVRVGDEASEPVSFPLVRLVSGSYVLHFIAGADALAGAQRAVVGTEMAPIMMLAGRGESPSVAHRALEVAAALNEVVKRPRTGGERPFFEPVDDPRAVGVAVGGTANVVAHVLPEDAAAYKAPPGLSPRGAAPARLALAAWWAALLNDYVAICQPPGHPDHVARLAPSAGATFTRLRDAVSRDQRLRVTNADVAGLAADLRQQLRQVALEVP